MNSLTISVVSHGHGPLLDLLLRDLDACEGLRGAQLVVTLNVADEPFDASRYQRISIVQIRNPIPRGFGENHNAAFLHCQTRWFAVVNPDLRIRSGEDPFSALVARLEQQEDLALSVPVVLNSDGAVEDSVRTNLTPASVLMRRLRPGAARVLKETEFRWFAGMCMIFKASAFQAIGGFDERYFLYCEDYDVCARLRLAGYSISQVTASHVVHDAQRDSHRSSRHLKWHLRSLFRVWTSAPFWRIAFGGHKIAEGARAHE